MSASGTGAVDGASTSVSASSADDSPLASPTTSFTAERAFAVGLLPGSHLELAVSPALGAPHVLHLVAARTGTWA